MGELYGAREAEIGRSLKSKRVQESRDRESAEGSENGIRIVAPERGFCIVNIFFSALKYRFRPRLGTEKRSGFFFVLSWFLGGV